MASYVSNQQCLGILYTSSRENRWDLCRKFVRSVYMRRRLGLQSNGLALVDELCKESIADKLKAMLYTLSNDSIPPRSDRAAL